MEMKKCAVCHEPVVSGVVVHSECMDRLQKSQQMDNKPLTIEELRTMGGQPIWHVELRPGGGKPHWEILRMSVARWPEDSRYGERWIAYRHKPREWISVKDRLPKRFETVLVVRKSKGQPLVTIGSMDINNYWSVPAGRVKSVTHWMPMPEPPEVECDL